MVTTNAMAGLCFPRAASVTDLTTYVYVFYATCSKPHSLIQILILGTSNVLISIIIESMCGTNDSAKASSAMYSLTFRQYSVRFRVLHIFPWNMPSTIQWCKTQMLSRKSHTSLSAAMTQPGWWQIDQTNIPIPGWATKGAYNAVSSDSSQSVYITYVFFVI